jgi:hypothetical protein
MGCAFYFFHTFILMRIAPKLLHEKTERIPTIIFFLNDLLGQLSRDT